MPTVGRFRKDGTLELIKSSISETLDVGGITTLSDTNVQGKLTINGDTQAGIIDATTITAGAVAANTFAGDGYQITNINWANVSGTPTTIAGYGITDAYTKNETLTILDDAFNQFTTGLVWKQPVANYDEIILTYGPNGNSIPKDGWTVNTTEDNKTWRYDGNEWVAINAGVIPLANREHDGLMTAGHFIKLEDMPAQQFSTIKVGSTLIPAELGKNTLELAPGQNITITPNAAAKSLTIANTYKYTHPNHSGDVVSTGDGVTAIQANAVTNVKIIDDAISTTKIQNNVVSNTKLAKVGATTIKGNKNATTSDVADLTPTEVRAMLNVADGANNYTHPNHSGDIVSTGDGATVIQSLAVTSGKIANSAVIDSKIATSAVTSSKIGPGAVLTDKVSDLAITTAKIADNAIVEAKIADGSVTTGKIATLAITETKIADSSVTNAKLGNASVTSTKISGKSVTDDKLADMPTNTLKGVTTAGTPTNLNANVIRGILGIENVQDGAEPNQNAFSNIKIGLDTLSADTKTDTFEIKAGQYITTALDQANSRITIGHNSITTNAPTKSSNSGSANVLFSTTVLNGHLTGGTYKTLVGGKDISISTSVAGDISISNNYEYTHPTGDGNSHVPATGTTNAGKFLTAGATAGSLSWTTPPVATTSKAGYLNTLSGSTSTFLRGDGTWATPALATSSSAGYMRPLNNSTTSFLDGTGNWRTIGNASDTTAGLIQFSGDTAHYLRGDGAWTTLPIYTRFGTGVDGLVPGRTHATGRTDYFLGEDGVWRQTKQYTVFTRSADGLVPKSGGVDGTNVKYLREDGTWQIPPDTKYTEFVGSDPGLVPNGAAYDGTYYLSGTGAWTRIPTATATVLGTVKIGANINISSGTISIANYEPAFTKNTAFNKSFSGNGSATTVSRSDHYHTHLDITDARSTTEAPNVVAASKMIKPTFVANTTDGLSDGGSYHGVLTFRRWGSGTDMSGGQINQLGFTDNGNLWMRTSTSATAWGTWKKFLDSTYSSIQTIDVTDSITGGGTGTTISIGHSTAAGHKHLPIGGSVGQILQNSASGTGVWATMPTLTRGTYLTGANYNGSTATTWAVDANTSAVANKIVARDGNGYISAMSVRSELANSSGTVAAGAALAYRLTSSDGHIRFTTDQTSIKTMAGLNNVNNWGASSDANANSTSQYATTAMVYGVKESLKIPGYAQSGATAYNFTNGILVETNIVDTAATMINLRITGNSYGSTHPYDIILQTYHYPTNNAFINNKAIATGHTLPIKAFCYDGKVHFWFAQTASYQSFQVELFTGNNASKAHTVTLKNLAEPTTGVTRLITITPDTVYHTGRKPTATDVGLGNVPNTVHTTASTINTVPVRDNSGDITSRLFRSEYANQATISGAMAFRVNASSDNYIRFCSDQAAIRAWLNVDAAGGSPLYVKKTGDTMSGTLTTKVAGVATALSGLTASISPIASSDVTVSTTGAQYVPMIHGSSALSGAGYRQHISIGHKRVGGNAWGNAYIAVGGNDAYPTKEWLFNGGSGAMTAPGSITATGALVTSDKLQSTKSGVTISISSENASYTHYSTTASTGHHFNKALYVAGEIYVGASYNQRVYNTGWKPTKADVGLPNVKDVSLNWSWGTANPTHIWGSQGDATQSYVYNGTQVKAFAGLGNVNNWGASSDISANSTSQYATTNMVAQVRAEKANTGGLGSSTNLDTINTNGIYTNTANANATTANKYPIAEAGALFAGVAAYSSSSQIYGAFNSNRWFVRGGGANTTSKTAWQELYHTGRKPTAADVGALPLSGGTMTGTITGKHITALGTGNDYHVGGIELLGNGSANTVFPTLGFHQPGVFASSLQVRSGGNLYFYTQGGSSLGNIHASVLNATSLTIGGSANAIRYDGSYIRLGGGKWIMCDNASTGYMPQASGTGSASVSYVGNSGWWFKEVWGNSLRGGLVDVSGEISARGNRMIIQGNSPTMWFQDTDSRSCCWHNNSNLMYLLRGTGANAISWDNGPNGRHPITMNLETGDCTFSGNVVAYSDSRLKKNIKKIENAISKISLINGVHYETIDGINKRIGVIAQEVREVFPEIVNEDSDGYLSVSYGNITAILIEGIKEQQQQIEEQKQQIEELKKMLKK